ncbi:hypothetical protein K443DRAFT_94720 [Laccaria amethystina LaAM-08-1]|uniref:Peptidase A1 domain-containing protein n=1 Tax=Laccaria amethystina LaAM-08-1 TaxID=1095629 RepID=A0A0C9WVS8_9AGAR|nr:hypothetical protein K443DRAFT_94720 [Laccaria amethystina LaAM-08-1]
MFPTTLLTTLFLALAVAANPILINQSPISLPLSRRLNLTSIDNLLKHDQARAKALKAAGTGGVFQSAAVVSEPIENQAVTYVASVGVRLVAPPPLVTYSLLIDTGSSNTWVGAGIPYVKTSTSVKTSNSVSVSYGSGSFSGTEYLDQVTVAPGLVIPNQSIGVASTSSGFSGFDGILGIGPVDLTGDRTLSPATTSSIPTVTDNLFANGVITANEIGVSFEPTTVPSVVNGELTWGGTDSSKFTGSINYTPLTTTYPAREYWGINQSIRYGTSTTILSSTAGIVDTGTTLILIATNALTKYKSATGAVNDNATGLLRITSTQYSNLKSLFFTTNGALVFQVTYELTANAQLWPRSLNTYIGGTTSRIYLIVNDIGATSGQGLDFINGYAFLERFYSVFDTANSRVGFATTPYTTATTN